MTTNTKRAVAFIHRNVANKKSKGIRLADLTRLYKTEYPDAQLKQDLGVKKVVTFIGKSSLFTVASPKTETNPIIKLVESSTKTAPTPPPAAKAVKAKTKAKQAKTLTKTLTKTAPPAPSPSHLNFESLSLIDDSATAGTAAALLKQQGAVGAGGAGNDMPFLLFDEDAPVTQDVQHLQIGSVGEDESHLFFQVNKPFSAVCVGVQGAGKSNFLSVVAETCLALPRPPVTLVLHYDKANNKSVSELISLSSPVSSDVPLPDVFVYTSASNYRQRRRVYDSVPRCQVAPLLLDFRSLSAKHLRTIMGLDIPNPPLYASVILAYLHGLQSHGRYPTYPEFLQHIGNELGLENGQLAMLRQRLMLLDLLVRGSGANEHLEIPDGVPAFVDCFSVGETDAPRVILLDLVNPLLTPSDANNTFDIAIDFFEQAAAPPGGKVLILDEAHKYVEPTLGPLNESLLLLQRQQRHLNLRLIISTQSPQTLHPELFELANALFLFHFFSPGWFQVLRQRVPIDPGWFDTLRAMGPTPGRAVLYTSRGCIGGCVGERTTVVSIKKSSTVDLGEDAVSR
jgi:hypothetical protein